MMDAIAVHANTKRGSSLDKNEPGIFHQTSGKVQGNYIAQPDHISQQHPGQMYKSNLLTTRQVTCTPGFQTPCCWVHTVWGLSISSVSWAKKSWRAMEWRSHSMAELLLAHYRLEQTHKWIEDKEIRDQITNQPLSMLNKVDRALLKKAVKAQHYSRDATWKLWVLVTPESPERLPQQHHIYIYICIQYTESEPWITSKWMHLMFPLVP